MKIKNLLGPENVSTFSYDVMYEQLEANKAALVL